MSQPYPAYPMPTEDADNAPYLRAWRHGVLLLQHCEACGREIFYPRSMCPDCWASPLSWKEASGHGTIVSFSLIYRPNHPAFLDEVPIALAEIALDEGASMLARVLGCAPQIGMRVKMATDVEAVERYPLPAFRPLA
ncbi:Zn-ribbon domain-containing OB-fold protein [Paraburkholderia sp. IW21]|uniref:Zn-ribbon domain-containing OB-fold protein n=1 Tax=Paraburkholderia sp. IW21 TaxID=3242488 RepID=UPI0035224326